jgi:uncharacterized protein (TIGR03084 family)
MSVLDDVLGDLAMEGLELREVVAGLSEAGWRTPTPAAGWDVATQIAHLAWTDEAALAAATDEGAWNEIVAEALADPDGFAGAAALALSASAPTTDLLVMWDEGRVELAEALRSCPAGRRLPWFGPPMSPASMATARFMETWAHGLDVREALGIEPTPTDRIRHVCHIGVRTRDFAYAVRELTPPAEEFRVELTAPSGAAWTWGPQEAAQRVAGSAWDFARLATQRVHRDDTDLVADGADAAQWLTIAQAFAGPPGPGRDRRG